jgi:hypothetical protein
MKIAFSLPSIAKVNDHGVDLGCVFLLVIVKEPRSFADDRCLLLVVCHELIEHLDRAFANLDRREIMERDHDWVASLDLSPDPDDRGEASRLPRAI